MISVSRIECIAACNFFFAQNDVAGSSKSVKQSPDRNFGFSYLPTSVLNSICSHDKNKHC